MHMQSRLSPMPGEDDLHPGVRQPRHAAGSDSDDETELLQLQVESHHTV